MTGPSAFSPSNDATSAERGPLVAASCDDVFEEVVPSKSDELSAGD